MAAALLGAPGYGNAATIGGEVKFVGAIPKRAPVQATKDQDYCGQTLPNETHLIGPGGGLKNVVVYIESASRDPALASKENILDNHGCRFVPRVMAMRWGERLVVKNSDPKLHIVHSYAEKRTVFNLSLPFRGSRIDITQKIRGPGLLQVNCDTHGWMRGYIHVFGHPFFAMSGESGSFTIADVSPGRYLLKAWHEDAGILSADVVVPLEGEAKIRFEFGKKAF
ncbi:MAG: hypothetical protein HYT78_15230 [Deltaproteobacteria bacterium]|nr:hypothetical protein [Deltaproteobacteria bacterium]